MREKTITMSRKEVKRLAVIQRLLHQQITIREAAMLLGLSISNGFAFLRFTSVKSK